MVSISFSIEDSQKKKLEYYRVKKAKEGNILTRSEIIQDAIEEYLEQRTDQDGNLKETE